MIELYPCFKHWKEANNIWVYSDPHFGDENMYRTRFPQAFNKHKFIVDNILYEIKLDEYSNENIVKWLDDWQIKRINSKVGKKDIIIFLGDIF